MYGEASGWSEWSDLRRTAFLLTSVGAEARRLYRAVVPADDAADLKGTVPAPKRSSNLLKRLRKIFAMPVRPRSVTEIRYNIIFPP